MGTQLPHGKGHSSHHFVVHLYGQTAGRIRIPLLMELGTGPGDIVLDGKPAPNRKGHNSPHFLAHVCCSQMAGWIKMPLGTQVKLGPGDVVLDGVTPP